MNSIRDEEEREHEEPRSELCAVAALRSELSAVPARRALDSTSGASPRGTYACDEVACCI